MFKQNTNQTYLRRNRLYYKQGLKLIPRLAPVGGSLLIILLLVFSIACSSQSDSTRQDIAPLVPPPSTSAEADFAPPEADVSMLTGQSYAAQINASTAGLNPQVDWFSIDDDSNTFSTAWGDVDEDGDLDLAVGNGGANKVYLNEEGVLQTIAYWSSEDEDSTRSVAWGDVDGDGDLDLAVGNRLSENKVYLNESGELKRTATWSSRDRDETQSVAWGDINGDGYLDLVVGNANAPNKVYLNTKTMSLLQTDDDVLWESSESDNTKSVALGHIDDDEYLDLVVGNNGTDNKIYLNRKGQLQETASWFSLDNDQTWSVALGDMDGNGKLDLAVGNEGQPNKVYLNVEGRLLQTAEDIPWHSEDDDHTRSVAWGDVDGDGDLDLAAGNFSTLTGGHNKVYLNFEGEMLETRASWISSDSDQTWSVAWGDVDGDGDLDLAVGNHLEANALHLNSGRTLQPTVFADGDRWTQSVAWGDVDGDGDLDLAVGNWSTRDKSEPNKVYLNEKGTLKMGTPFSSPLDDTSSVAWGDVNCDGALDLAVGNRGENRVYFNDGQELQMENYWSSKDLDQTNSVAWGDVDNDGDLDLAVGNRGPDFGGEPNRVYLNEDGMLQRTAIPFSYDSDDTRSVAWGDVDGDGDLDLAVGNSFGENKVYLNEGGILQNRATWVSGDYEQTTSVAWGDVDGDGDLDLAVGNSGGTNKVYLNIDGALQTATDAPWISADSDDTTDVAWGDVDGDGDLDLAVGNSGRPNKIYLNENGILQNVAGNVLIFGVNDNTTTIAWGDVDGDGNLDLATGNYNGPKKIYLNKSPAHSLQPSRSAYVALNLSSNPVKTCNNQVATALAPANFYAVPAIRQAITVPVTYTLFNPDNKLMSVRAFYSPDGSEGLGHRRWYSALPASETQTTALNLGTYVYTWDVLTSRFFGQSDNVVFRIEAYFLPGQSHIAGTYRYTNTIPGPYQSPYVAAQTFPFRVRGSQVRVYQEKEEEGNEAEGALVYRLNQDSAKFEPYTNLAGQPFRTDSHGYLQGRGTLAKDDRLVALLPITWTDSYTLYYTSARPTETGLEAYTVNKLGVQPLTVSADHSLILFNLDVALEWDARQDAAFLSQLKRDLERTSEILYDLSNGQIALGNIRVYQAKEHWLDAHIVIHASNSLRPNADLGGVVISGTHEIVGSEVITTAYIPGQVRMGPTWTRFGNATTSLGEDWPRVLAHELGHYLLYLPDNYLGLDRNKGLLIQTDCRGSAMTDPYRTDYSEFLTETGWTGDCLKTLAEDSTGRSDWETIETFYADLNDSTTLTGPTHLPLQVTRVDFLPVNVLDNAPEPLAAPFFSIAYLGHPYQSSRAEGYLIKAQKTPDTPDDPTDDYVIPLGAPHRDLMQARGATPGDRLCVFDYSQPSTMRLGCLPVGQTESELTLHDLEEWPPQLTVTAVNSRTFVITASQVSADDLYVQLLPDVRPLSEYPERASEHIKMEPVGPDFVSTIEMAEPVFGGFVRVWVKDSQPARELLTRFSLGEGWEGYRLGWGGYRLGWGGFRRGWGGYRLGWGGYRMGWGAPVYSDDGQVAILNLENPLANDTTYILQTLPTLPNLDSWLILVGQGYHFSTEDEPPLSSIMFRYLERDVPGGQERGLRVYYLPDKGEQKWLRLETELNTARNLASANMPGQGTYALISTIEIPPLTKGWNLFGYPVSGSRSVTEALASVEDDYTSIYHYDPQGSSTQWTLYDQTVLREHPEYAGFVNDLTHLEYGQVYWIHALTDTKIYLPPALVPQSRFSWDFSQKGYIVSPPSTFYGPIKNTGSLTLIEGMPVTAEIDGKVCGQSTVQIWDDQPVYKLQVIPPDSCGVQNSNIVFKVQGQVMAGNREWDNTQAQFQTLGDQQPGSLNLSTNASPSPVPAGAMLTYTIHYTVTGSESAIGLTIVDVMPQGTTYHSCQGGLSCNAAGDLVTWQLGDVAPPMADTVTLVVRVDSSLPSGTILTNEATLADTTGRSVTDRITTPVSGPSACDNRLVNGDMESDEGWILNLGKVAARYVPDPRGSGRSLAIGLDSKVQSCYSCYEVWSSARQPVTLPVGKTATLSLKYLVEADPWPGCDVQRVMILNPRDQLQRESWILQSPHSEQWQDFIVDIPEKFKGQSVEVYVGVTNDGFGGATRMLVDDVTLCVR